MSRIQRFFIRIFPRRWAEDMEADSRRWILHCNKCGFEQSIWDIGGIRWKASGKKRIWWRCNNCHKRSWHAVSYRRPEA